MTEVEHLYGLARQPSAFAGAAGFLREAPLDRQPDIAILVVDDEAISRDGLEALVQKFYPNAFARKCADAGQALNLLRRHAFDLVLIDIGLKAGLTGFELLRELRLLDSPNHKVPVLIVSGRDDLQNVQAAYRYGANGFLPKGSSDLSELRGAVLQTLNGGTYTPPGCSAKFMSEMTDNSKWDHFKLLEEIAKWTDRQRQVALWKYWGVADKVIARHLHISESVVRKHAEVIFHKLGVSKRAQFMVLLGDHVVKQNAFWPKGDIPCPPSGEKGKINIRR